MPIKINLKFGMSSESALTIFQFLQSLHPPRASGSMGISRDLMFGRVQEETPRSITQYVLENLLYMFHSISKISSSFLMFLQFEML